MKQIAQIISYGFHPLLMPIFGVAIIIHTDSYINYVMSQELKRAVLILVGTNTLVMPLLVSFVLLNKKRIKNLMMENRKERIIPYATVIIFYLVAFYLLKQAPIPSVILRFIVGATLSIIIALIITIKWKISAHMIGIGGVVGLLLCAASILEIYVTPYLMLFLLVAGLTGSSRLILKAHNSAQLYVGFCIGILCQFVVICF